MPDFAVPVGQKMNVVDFGLICLSAFNSIFQGGFGVCSNQDALFNFDGMLKMFVRLLFLSLFVAYGTMSSVGAEISRSANGECTVKLTGRIETGDFAKLLAISEENGWTNGAKFVPAPETYSRVLCLNSPGGSYLEGRLLSELVFEAGIGTRIAPNSECFSACALIFMAGRNRGDEVDGPHRILNIRASLGFHAAYVDLDDNKSFTSIEVENFVEINSLLIADLLRFSSYSSVFSAEPMISRSLVADLLTFKKGEMLVVSTVEDSARWGITLDGAKPRWKLDETTIAQACENFQNWVSDRNSSVVDLSNMNLYKIEKIKIKNEEGNKEFLKIDTGGYADRYCLVSVEESDAETYLEICSRNDFNGVHHGSCPDYGFILPAYYAMSPKTPIANLAE